LAKLLEDGGTTREDLTRKEIATLAKLRADAIKGSVALGKEQGAALTDYFKHQEAQSASLAKQQAKDFADRRQQVQQEIADYARLGLAQVAGGTGTSDIVAKRLKDEADLRQLTKGLTVEQAAAITALVMVRNRERDAIEAAQKAEKDKAAVEAAIKAQLQGASVSSDIDAERQRRIEFGKSLTAIDAETTATERMTAAQKQGPEAVAALNRELFIQKGLLEAGATSADKIALVLPHLAKQWDALTKAAKPMKTAWIEATKAIEKAAEGMADAFADNGLAGVAQYAASEAKVMFAEAIKEGAYALASLAFGPILGKKAADHAAAAAGFTAAGLAFSALGHGSGSSTGAPSGGGVGSSPDMATGTSTKPAAQEITIVFSGPGFNAVNPEVQSVIFAGYQLARERFGSNVKIRTITRSS
jgi:hypothetical protein